MKEYVVEYLGTVFFFVRHHRYRQPVGHRGGTGLVHLFGRTHLWWEFQPRSYYPHGLGQKTAHVCVDALPHRPGVGRADGARAVQEDQVKW